MLDFIKRIGLTLFNVRRSRSFYLRLIAISVAACILVNILQNGESSNEIQPEIAHRQQTLNAKVLPSVVISTQRPRTLDQLHKRHSGNVFQLKLMGSHDSVPTDQPKADSHSALIVEFSEKAERKLSDTLITDNAGTKETWNWGNDIRKQCAAKTYQLDKLPKSSIIISFHENESLSHLLRTIHSIIKRTPPELLEEIILINDNSHKEDHEMILQNYVNTVFYSVNIRLLHSKTQLGLIRARLAGALLAKGEVIVSMDSHMEVQERWLEPLLEEIRKNPRTMATSYLDWMEREIGSDNWMYKHGPSTWKTYFDWSFVFGFQDTAKSQLDARADVTVPIQSPVSIGTIWAMNREVFNEIGAFDAQMEGWGGENVDLPLRVWFCGGQVVNVPCSHAGHLEEHGHRDYRKNWASMTHRNYKRVAEVWLDDYKKYFYYYHPQLLSVEVGDLSARREIKDHCFLKYGHNFTWFLDNVFPELGLPGGDMTLAWDGLQNLALNVCLTATPPADPYLEECSGNPINQGVFWDTRGHLRFPVHAFNGKRKGPNYSLVTVEYVTFHGSSNDVSRWIHAENGWIMWYPLGVCLHATNKRSVTLAICDEHSLKQKWRFKRYTEKFRNIVESIQQSASKEHPLNQTVFSRVFGVVKARTDELYRQKLADVIDKNLKSTNQSLDLITQKISHAHTRVH